MAVEDVLSPVMTEGIRQSDSMTVNQSSTEANAWDATCASLFVRMMRLKQEKSVEKRWIDHNFQETSYEHQHESVE